MLLTPQISKTPQRGAILILVLLFTGLMASAVLSYNESIGDGIDVTRDIKGSISAEFASESGLAYAQRRLILEPDWSGTGDDGYMLPDGETRFIIQVQYDPDYEEEEDDGDDDGNDDDEHDDDEDEDDDDCDDDDDDEHDCDDDDDDEHDCDDDDDDDHGCDDDGDCNHGDDEDDCGYSGDDEDDEDDDDDCDDDDDEDEDDEGDGNGCHSGCICCGGVGDCAYDCDSRHDHRDDICDDEDDLDGDDEDDCGYSGEGEDEDEDEDDEDEDDEDCDDDDDDEDENDDGGSSSQPLFVHNLEVSGINDGARSKLGGVVNVYVGEGGNAHLALLFLGDDLKLKRSTIEGDVIITDKANRALDWHVNGSGEGAYQSGDSNTAGQIKFNNSDVDGTLYRYTDTNSYQDLGTEKVISDFAKAPVYTLEGLTSPGSGKTIYEDTTNLSGVILENTAIVKLSEGEHLVLDNCTLRGGLIVIAPDGVDLRDGPRNTIELKNTNIIGGGTEGAEENIGIFAPGCALQVDSSGATIQGLSYLNQLNTVKQTSFIGQVIVLNRIIKLVDSSIEYDQDVAYNLPDRLEMGGAKGHTDVLRVFEDF